jgi:hypothetical protein
MSIRHHDGHKKDRDGILGDCYGINRRAALPTTLEWRRGHCLIGHESRDDDESEVVQKPIQQWDLVKVDWRRGRLASRYNPS